MHVAYLTSGDKNFASSRLRAWLPGAELARLGHEVAFNDGVDGADIVVFQKRFNDRDQKLMRECRERGIKVVLDVDDMMSDIPFHAVDAITTDTQYKADSWPGAFIVPDVCDVNAGTKRKTVHTDDLKRVVWVGNAENTYHLRDVSAACKYMRIELVVITDLNNRAFAHYDNVSGVAWDLNTVDEEMIKADVAVMPLVFDHPMGHRRDWIESKSENKLIKSWALGLPVVATAIPSYMKAGLRYSAGTVEGWIDAFTQLTPRAHRVDDAKRGIRVAKNYTADKIALQWLKVFQDVTGK